MISVFTEKRILLLHNNLIEKYGGLLGYEQDTLDSVLKQPYQTIFGKDAYPSDTEKLCRLVFGLTTKHPFKDGNKRIGALILYIGLDLLNYNLNMNNAARISLSLNLASGLLDYTAFVRIVETNISKGQL